MVRDTVPPPSPPSKRFVLCDMLGKTMIKHGCIDLNPHYVDIDFTGNCLDCGCNYAFEALRAELE